MKIEEINKRLEEIEVRQQYLFTRLEANYQLKTLSETERQEIADEKVKLFYEQELLIKKQIAWTNYMKAKAGLERWGVEI